MNTDNENMLQTLSQSNSITKVFICTNGDCAQKENALEVIAEVQKWILDKHLGDFDTPHQIKCIPCGCLDVCQQGPIVRLLPDNVTYWKITPRNILGILEDHIFKGNIRQENLAVPKKTHSTEIK